MAKSTLKSGSSNLKGLPFGLGVVALLAAVAAVACGDDAADRIGGRGPGGRTGNEGTDGDGGAGGGGAGEVTYEEQLFRGVEAEMQKKCGGANGVCHKDGTYKPQPPTFLAPPDAYKSITGHPGLVTKDVYESALVTKPQHAGPSLAADPEFEKKVVEWLNAEALVLNSVKKPSTDAGPIKQGANDIDMSKACIGGLVNVHLKFEAALVGTSLALSNIKLVAPAGTDVHILKPKFYRISAENKEYEDAANQFENIDQTVAGGTEAPLGPGAAFFSSPDWRPYNFGADKIRIEVEKLEPGKVQVIEPPKVCKNVANFTANVLPSLRGQAGGFLNCANCHGNGLAGLSLNNGDQALVCNQVLGKLNAPPNLGASIMITKVVTGPHSGGITPNAGNWAAVFTGNQAVFF